MEQGKIVKVAGPLVVASGMGNANMYDVVKVGKLGLILLLYLAGTLMEHTVEYPIGNERTGKTVFLEV